MIFKTSTKTTSASAPKMTSRQLWHLNFTAWGRRTSTVRLTSTLSLQKRESSSSGQDGPQPSSTSVDDVGDTSAGPLKARLDAKGYSQYIEDHIKQTFVATPAMCDISSFLTRPSGRTSSYNHRRTTRCCLEATSGLVRLAYITQNVAGTSTLNAS